MTYRVAMVGAFPYPAPQGSQLLFRATAEALRDAGHEVRLVVYGHGAGEEHTGLPVHRCPRVPGGRRISAGPSRTKPLLDALMIRTLCHVIREHAIQIVHAHNYEALLAALAAGAGPIVYHAHTAMAEELPYFMWPRKCARAVGAWLDRTFPRRADVVIAPHERLAEYLITQGCDADRVHVIPPCIPPLEVPLETAPGGGAPAVLYMGNTDAYQNLELLWDAMRIVWGQAPETRLVIATHETKPRVPTDITHDRRAEIRRLEGEGDLVRTLAEEVVAACPRVAWTGYPMKLLNAMAAGRAIVACADAAPGLRDGVDAALVRGGSAEDFAGALMNGLSNPEFRARLGAGARDTFLERHTPSHAAAAIARAYRTLTPPD